jgi:hypothetical protein
MACHPAWHVHPYICACAVRLEARDAAARIPTETNKTALARTKTTKRPARILSCKTIFNSFRRTHSRYRDRRPVVHLSGADDVAFATSRPGGCLRRSRSKPFGINGGNIALAASSNMRELARRFLVMCYSQNRSW